MIYAVTNQTPLEMRSQVVACHISEACKSQVWTAIHLAWPLVIRLPWRMLASGVNRACVLVCVTVFSFWLTQFSAVPRRGFLLASRSLTNPSASAAGTLWERCEWAPENAQRRQRNKLSHSSARTNIHSYFFLRSRTFFFLCLSFTHTLAVYSLPGRLTNSCRPPSFLITLFLQSKVCNVTAIAFRPSLSSESIRVIHSLPSAHNTLDLLNILGHSLCIKLYLCSLCKSNFISARERSDRRVTLGT